MKRRFLTFFLAAVFVLTPLLGGFDAGASLTFDFPVNIMYGGTSADCGDLIYYSAGGEIRVREVGGDESAFVIAMDARCLNVDGGYIYFLCGDGIYRCGRDGGGLTLLYSGLDLSCLYVSGSYIYFMSGTTVYRLMSDRAIRVFSQQDMQCFIPVAANSFNWYVSNPDFDQNDDCHVCGDDEDSLLGFNYSAVTGVSIPLDTAGESDDDVGDDEGYAGPYVDIAGTTLPLSEHMPGTYFTKDGQACTCHGNPYIDHIASPDSCNCMRYYPTGDPDTCEVDLLGSQCFAFCRLIFYKCFGFIDHQDINPGKFHSIGSLDASDATANTCRELLSYAAAGAHIRLRREHSMAVLTMDEDSITVYHANAGGDGVVSSPCVVSTRRLTWQDFANNWAYRGIAYVNMPDEYPEGTEIKIRRYQTGVYRVKSDSMSALNIRSAPDTSSDILGRYSAGQYVTVIDVDGNWGLTDLGWISLIYCNFITSVTLSPSEDSIFSVEDDYLIVRGDRASFDEFCQSLYNQNACGYSMSHIALDSADYLTTGCTVALVYDGHELSAKTVVVLGDINCNGIVDVADYVAAKRIILGLLQPTGLQELSADIDRSGSVDAIDYIRLARYLRTGEYS